VGVLVAVRTDECSGAVTRESHCSPEFVVVVAIGGNEFRRLVPVTAASAEDVRRSGTGTGGVCEVSPDKRRRPVVSERDCYPEQVVFSTVVGSKLRLLGPLPVAPGEDVGRTCTLAVGLLFA